MNDSDLKYIQRVLESNAPDEDRERAAQMVRDIRRSYGRPSHWPVEEQPDGTVTPVDPADIGQDAAIEAIQFALEADEGIAWLRCWNEGDFDACRREWPETPEKCFIGADPLHPATRSAPVAAQAPAASAEPVELVEAVTKAILFEDSGSTADWRDNTNLGQAAIRAYATAVRAAIAPHRAEQVALMQQADKDGRAFNAQGHSQAIQAIDVCLASLAAPVAAKDHPRFIAGYDAGMADARRMAASAEPVPVEIERLAINRYRPVPAGALAYKVVAGDGSRSLFSGTKDECQIVARKLTEAFLDGAHVAINAAPVADQAPQDERMETTSEHIARDIREGRFPQRSEPQRVQATEWGPMPDAGVEADAHVAVIEGDEAVRVLRWNSDLGAFSYPVGTRLYAAGPFAVAPPRRLEEDAFYATLYRWLRANYSTVYQWGSLVWYPYDGKTPERLDAAIIAAINHTSGNGE